MEIGIGYCDHADSAFAGQTAVKQAFGQAGKKDPCDLILLFSTSSHNFRLLRDAVSESAGGCDYIVGGGSCGIITNDIFGYAGNQVGLVCFWFNDEGFFLENVGGPGKSEKEIGQELGKKLINQQIHPGLPIMLFYNAVRDSKTDLTTASWILDNIEKELGFPPNIIGAGYLADHIWSPVDQFVGNQLGRNFASTLTFSDNIKIEHTFLHGCRPSSPYYKITKTKGSIIQEIEGMPALDFLDQVLDGNLNPEEYPFFLILGKNLSDNPASFDWRNYAIRFCKAVDLEEKSIIMFEPDMVEGTKFQIMSRTQGFDYMYREIQALIDKLEGKKPIFAFYIDCAGRCAGYGGSDFEDAYVIQETIGKLCPVFGIYSGTEIAPLNKRLELFYWTGVLSIFYKDSSTSTSVRDLDLDYPPKSASDKADLSSEDLKKLCQISTGQSILLESQNIIIRNELEHKRRTFKLLTDLSAFIKEGRQFEEILQEIANEINSTLNMHRTIFLFPEGKGVYVPTIVKGYTANETEEVLKADFKLNGEFTHTREAIMVTGAEDETSFIKLKEKLKLPYFISVPIEIDNQVIGVIITGRTTEAPPFSPRLTNSDVETIQAIVGLLASTILFQKLELVTEQASLDCLTGLLNRTVLEEEAKKQINRSADYHKAALMIIDLDKFKDINDYYGHLVGDKVLRTLAKELKESFRTTDIIARFGGDEFVIVATMVSSREGIIKKLEKLINKWREIRFKDNEGGSFSTSLSVGIAFYPKDGGSYEELFQKADIALYESKEKGRDGYTVYKSNIDERFK